MTQITIENLAERMAALAYGEQLIFFATEEGDSYGAARMKLFEADMIVINYFGGGNPFIIDTEWAPSKDIVPCILHGLQQYQGYNNIGSFYINEPDYPRYDPEKLLSQQELIDMLEAWGGHDRALSHLREHYDNELGSDPIWRYPISLDTCNGGFLVPVKEGYLFIPYDEVDAEDYEILMLDKTCLMDAETCAYMARECQGYTDALCEELHKIGGELETRQTKEEKA